LDYPIPTQVYHDCYIRSDVGQQTKTERVKRNQWASFRIPVNELGNATMNLYPGSVLSILGRVKDITKPDEESGELGAMHPD
jgi:hypothetical protein